MIGQGMNGSIRADGSPRYAMACTLAGAFTNLIFDPVLIIGFNMGADHMERVKETIQLITKYVLLVGIVAFLIFEIVPDAIIMLFGSHNTAEYMEYARLCIRIFLGGIILTCYIKSAAIILQSMGSSVKSTVLALLRDVIIFVPASIILASLSKSIVTMLWAAVISDIIAAIVGFLFVRTELHPYPVAFRQKN